MVEGRWPRENIIGRQSKAASSAAEGSFAHRPSPSAFYKIISLGARAGQGGSTAGLIWSSGSPGVCRVGEPCTRASGCPLSSWDKIRVLGASVGVGGMSKPILGGCTFWRGRCIMGRAGRLTAWIAGERSAGGKGRAPLARSSGDCRNEVVVDISGQSSWARSSGSWWGPAIIPTAASASPLW